MANIDIFDDDWVAQWFEAQGWKDDEPVDDTPQRAADGLQALADVPDPPDLATDPVRQQQLNTARQAIATDLQPPLDKTKVGAALQKIAAFKQLCAEAGEAIRAEIARKKLEADAKDGLTDLDAVKDPDDLATDPVRQKQLTDARQALAKDLTPPLERGKVDTALQKIAGFKQLCAEAGEAIRAEIARKKLEADAKQGLTGLDAVKEPDDLATDPVRQKQLTDARQALAKDLTPPLERGKVDTARQKIAAFKQLCAEAGEAIRAEIARKKLEADAKQGLTELQAVKEPDDLATDPVRQKQLTDARQALAKDLTPPLERGKVDTALQKIVGFKQLCAEAGEAIRAEIARKKLEGDALQGRTDLAEVKDPDNLATDEALKKQVDDARKLIADDLNPPLEAGKVAAARSQIAGFKKLCETTAATLTKQKAKAKFSGVKLGDVPLDEPLFDAMFEVFGGAGLETLIADFGDATSLATACSGFKAPPGALKQLKALAESGLGGGKGLKVMLATGCGGDPARLRAFADQFASEPDQKALGTLLKDGMAGKADALAHLLATGCDGKADTFKTLADAFKDKPSQAQLKGLLEAGGFGDKPEVFAHVFKSGCAGNPATLKKLHTEFKDKLPKLKALITDGGMAEKPESFAQVMGTTLDGDPAKLVQFQQAFDGPAELAKLKTLMGALETNPTGVEGNPGKALKTVLDARHLNTADYSKLNTKFYATIKAQAGADDAKLKQLLRAAPTFTKTPMSGAPETLPQPDNLATHGQKTSRMKHFLDRHTRAHYGGANDTNNSFFPEGTSEDEVADMLKEALDTMAADPGRLRNNGGGSKKYVPLKSAGIWVQIGVKPVPNAASPNIPGDVGPIAPPPPAYKYVDQFFPISDANVAAFHNADVPPGLKAWYEGIIDPANGWPTAPKNIETFSRQEMAAMLAAARA